MSEYKGLPREDRGAPLACVHPDPNQTCDEEAAWYVWYARSGGLYTYSCHDHLIERLRSVTLGSIVQIRRTPRWEPTE
jgi:hypothetical protein